jgi:hypothetical protein
MATGLFGVPIRPGRPFETTAREEPTAARAAARRSPGAAQSEKRSSRTSLALRLAAASLAALVAADAAAIVLDTSVTRNSERDSSAQPFTVSYADCIDGNQFVFILSDLTAGDTLSLWATGSSDCTDLTTRNDGLCTTLISAFQLSDDTASMRVDSADIANSLSNVSDCVDSGAIDAPRPIKLYFLVDEETDPVSEFATYATKVDVRGPAAPTEVTVGLADDGALAVSYTESSSSTDIAGYHFYCEALGEAPTGGEGGANGAGGMAGLGGSEAGTGAASGECVANTLVPGELAPVGLGPCGDTQSTTQGLAQGLTNFVRYAVAVAGYDDVGNVGPLSGLACGMPEPVDDFFDLYRKAGGQAGGGFCGYCSVRCSTSEQRGGVATAVSVGLLLGWRRTVRRRHERSRS